MCHQYLVYSQASASLHRLSLMQGGRCLQHLEPTG